ncbi:MAG: HPr family phosphocarrier protein [Betaproteobacteria bacterium]|nr:HPr family phosphocarrier protein [Betaproteobacteria bacterium]
MQYREVVVINPLGLHARPSAQVTQVASRFRSEVWLTRNSRRVNAKSIMGVMMLAAAKGSAIGIETDGPDETQALSALVDLFAAGFNEVSG